MNKLLSLIRVFFYMHVPIKCTQIKFLLFIKTARGYSKRVKFLEVKIGFPVIA